MSDPLFCSKELGINNDRKRGKREGDNINMNNFRTFCFKVRKYFVVAVLILVDSCMLNSRWLNLKDILSDLIFCQLFNHLGWHFNMYISEFDGQLFWPHLSNHKKTVYLIL